MRKRRVFMTEKDILRVTKAGIPELVIVSGGRVSDNRLDRGFWGEGMAGEDFARFKRPPEGNSRVHTMILLLLFGVSAIIAEVGLLTLFLGGGGGEPG